MRDLPMPGSPESSTTWPSAFFARSHRRSSNWSSSLSPPSGAGDEARNASNRLTTALGLSTCQADTVPKKPRASTAPRSRYSNNPPMSRRVFSSISTAFGSAKLANVRRGLASPTTSCAGARRRRPPYRWRCLCVLEALRRGFRPDMASTANAQRAARSASSSCARG